MTTAVQPIPKGYHTITPYLVARDADAAATFYQKAFGARETMRLLGSDGKTAMHIELQIGNSIFFLGVEAPTSECKAPPDLKWLQRHALPLCGRRRFPVPAGRGGRRQGGHAAPGHVLGRPHGTLEDPFGHRWSVGTHIEDISSEEVQRRAVAFFAAKR